MNVEKEKTQKRIKSLVNFIAHGKKEGKNLSELFSEYAKKTGKAKGSIRNIYYELLAKIEELPHLKTQLLGQENFNVQKKQVFTEGEEKELLYRLFSAKKRGVSVRQALLSLANDNPTLALRYQNKYRNLLTKNPALVLSVLEDVRARTGYSFNPYERVKKEQPKESAVLKKLARLKQENARLKEKLFLAESKVTQTALSLSPTATNVPTLSPTQTKKQA